MQNGDRKCIRNLILKRRVAFDWLFQKHFLPQQVGRKTGGGNEPKTGIVLVHKRG